MLNLQELATIKRHRLPVRLFVVNNSGYSMVKQTQDQWLGADYNATSYEGGLDFPDFSLVALSFDIPAIRIEKTAMSSRSSQKSWKAMVPFCAMWSFPQSTVSFHSADMAVPSKMLSPCWNAKSFSRT